MHLQFVLARRKSHSIERFSHLLISCLPIPSARGVPALSDFTPHYTSGFLAISGESGSGTAGPPAPAPPGSAPPGALSRSSDTAQERQGKFISSCLNTISRHSWESCPEPHKTLEALCTFDKRQKAASAPKKMAGRLLT